MATEPLTPQEVDTLLRPDWRTTTADLLVLRDSLLRMRDAFARLATTAERLQHSARQLEAMSVRSRASANAAANAAAGTRAPRD